MSSPSGTEASTTSSSPNSVVATAGAGGNNAPKYGTLVPNRIFVGGISLSTTEAELAQLFSAYGNVRATKIINDRAGVSKGYGFVTFETEEEARRLQAEGDCIVLKERKLNIAPAIKKQASVYPLQPFNRGYETAPTVPSGTVFFHNGYPYTYQNGMAFYAPGSNNTPDVAAAANGYVPAPYPQPQPPPPYPPATVMFQQPMYIPQQYQYQAIPPSSPVPSQYLYTSAPASNNVYGTANGSGGGSGGGGNSSSGGGGGGGCPSNVIASNHQQSPSTYFGPPPTSTLLPPQGPPPMHPLTLAPPPPQHHQIQHPPPAQVAVPEMYMTGPSTAIYTQQTAYQVTVPEIYETPPMTELSSAQSTEDSSSNSSRSGPPNQTNGASKVSNGGGAKITPSTPVVSLLRLNLQDEKDDEIEGVGNGEGEIQEQGNEEQSQKAIATTVQQPQSLQKRADVNGVNSHNYYHRPPHHRTNQIQSNPNLSQPLLYLSPNYIHSPNHFPSIPPGSGYFGPPPPMSGSPHPLPRHIFNSGRGQHHGGSRMPPQHDQRFMGRSRPNPCSSNCNNAEGKKYPLCIPEGLFSSRSSHMQGSTAIMYTPMGLPNPGINSGGRQQRRYGNGPRRQGGRNIGGNGGGDAGSIVRPGQMNPSNQQRQKLGKCNRTVNGSRQGSYANSGMSTENMPRNGSGDGPHMPITPPGTPTPATARDISTQDAAVGPGMVGQMQALRM